MPAHPAAPDAGEIVATEALTADGNFNDQASAAITGAGHIVGYDFDGADGNGFVVKDVDGSGTVLIDTKLGVNAHETHHLPVDLWRRYTNGFYGDVPAAGGRAVVYYRPD